jgi:hypothetical protein
MVCCLSQAAPNALSHGTGCTQYGKLMVMLAAICSVLSVFTQWKIRCLQEK